MLTDAFILSHPMIYRKVSEINIYEYLQYFTIYVVNQAIITSTIY